MAQLVVRNLDDELVRQLKRRGAEHGRSAEARWIVTHCQMPGRDPTRCLVEIRPDA